MATLKEHWIEWNKTARDYPRERNVHALFSEVAAHHPACIALRCGEQSFTYSEVDRLSNQVAGQLVADGIMPGACIAVVGCRKPELIVAMLGILKAGCAYVPIDPAYPRERIEFMLNDSECAAVFQDTTRNATAQSNAARHYKLDDSLLKPATNSICANVESVSSTSMAYIMYTSGSTGRPRGVQVTHRGIVRLVRNTNYATFAAGDVFLHAAPISFDASTFEVWAPLLNGATLALIPQVRPDLSELAHALKFYGANCLCFSTGLFHVFVDERLADLSGVRFILVGGDVMSAAHARRLKSAHPRCELLNGYGPTECATMATCYVVPDSFNQSQVPIGRPISNTRVYLLNETGDLADVGEEGEICIAGDAVALGYLNQPETTREKFRPDPFGGQSSAMYRTGDRAFLRDDGELIFCGRADHQVKLRGFRVEPGEVDAALLKNPAVRNALTVVRPLGTSRTGLVEQQLVSFVVLQQAHCLQQSDLNSYLQALLPVHMVPSRILELDALPLTANGKVDRQLLVDPSFFPYVPTATSQEPSDEVQQTIARIWSEVLGLSRVGMDDVFFEAGGSSLLLVKLQNRLAEAFKTQFPLADLFTHTTIRAQARRFSRPSVVQDIQTSMTDQRASKQRSAFGAFKAAATQGLNNL